MIAWGWNSTYGQSILIANRNGMGIYLLAHLSKYNTSVLEKNYIQPLDTVGYVGESGDNKNLSAYPGNSHLHVTYFDADYRKEYFGNIASGPDKNDMLVRASGFDAIYSESIRNPFDHAIKWLEKLGG